MSSAEKFTYCPFDIIGKTFFAPYFILDEKYFLLIDHIFSETMSFLLSFFLKYLP